MFPQKYLSVEDKRVDGRQWTKYGNGMRTQRREHSLKC
jgi:hypothetical protein